MSDVHLALSADPVSVREAAADGRIDVLASEDGSLFRQMVCQKAQTC